MRLLSLALALSVPVGCAPMPGPAAVHDAPPPSLIGSFVDDYQIGYVVTAQTWDQRPGGRYHILRWRPAPGAQTGYLIAQNDTANASDAGRWTRIDWVRLDGMAPYEWAFCMSVYDAPSAEAAESSRVARTDTPRDGCNGHPFSRMRRVDPDAMR